MNKRNILWLISVALCVAMLLGYKAVDRIRTDTVAPEIHMDDQVVELSVTDPDALLLQGITATDDRDGSVTDSLIVEKVQMMDPVTGRVKVKVAAFDKAGNVAKAEREAFYTDYESPHFTLSNALIFEQGFSFDVLNYITASDNLDGEITYRVRVTSLAETSVTQIGVHDVMFRVSNSLGDTVELVIPVEIVDGSAYNASLTLKDYLIYLDVGDTFNERAYLETFRYGANNISLQQGLPADYALETSGTVNTSEPGVYYVTYKVTYTRPNAQTWNQSYCGYSRLIVVVEG